MNSMKQHAPIWNGVKADYPAWLWEAVPFLDSMGLKKYRPPVLNEEQHTNMLKHGTPDEITKAESMLEKLFRVFLRMISRSKDHPEAITLRMMIQAEFAEERDGFLLMLYIEGYANDQSVAEVKVLKRAHHLSLPHCVSVAGAPSCVPAARRPSAARTSCRCARAPLHDASERQHRQRLRPRDLAFASRASFCSGVSGMATDANDAARRRRDVHAEC